MTAERLVCRQCGKEFVRLDAVTFEARGFLLCEHGFCDEPCAAKWALAEVARARSWLRRIAARTRGMGADLATIALHSDTWPDALGPQKRDHHG